MLHAWFVVDVYSTMMTSSSFTAGKEPLPDDVDGTICTCVAAMTPLRTLGMRDISLDVMKTLAVRTQPLEDLTVLWLPGVNWVSVFCQCAHNTVLLVAVCSVGWLVSSDYCLIYCRWYCSTPDVVM